MINKVYFCFVLSEALEIGMMAIIMMMMMSAVETSTSLAQGRVPNKLTTKFVRVVTNVYATKNLVYVGKIKKVFQNPNLIVKNMMMTEKRSTQEDQMLRSVIKKNLIIPIRRT